MKIPLHLSLLFLHFPVAYVSYGIFLFSMMNAFSEGLVLAGNSGLDPHTLLDVLVR